MEHRGLIGAIGIALVSIGLSGLFAYSTAAFALTRTFHWLSSFAFAGEVVTAAGIGTLIVTVRLIIRRRQRLRRINEFTGSGIRLWTALKSMARRMGS